MRLDRSGLFAMQRRAMQSSSGKESVYFHIQVVLAAIMRLAAGSKARRLRERKATIASLVKVCGGSRKPSTGISSSSYIAHDVNSRDEFARY